jgi:thiazole synthase/sulfur carrier protein
MKTKITINGNKVDWQERMTVRDALKLMNYTFPMLVIKVNGKLIPKSDYDSTHIPVGADVMVIHLISGG